MKSQEMSTFAVHWTERFEGDALWLEDLIFLQVLHELLSEMLHLRAVLRKAELLTLAYHFL